jgi:hypothetical protein
MKIKQFFLLPAALMAAFLFAYGTKEQQSELTSPANNPNVKVEGRAAKCLVTVSVTAGSVTVCGTNNQLAACGNVGATILRGTEVINAPLARVYGVFVPTGGLGFLQLTAGPAGATVTVSTASNSQTYSVFPANAPLTVSIDELCNIQ